MHLNMEAKPREFDLEEVSALLEGGDANAVHSYVEELPMGERARLLSRLSDGEQETLLESLPAEFAADVIEGLGETQSAELLESVSPELAARVLDRVHSDEQADLLSECDEEAAEAILRAMEPEEANDARQLMQYEWDTAGGMMITEFLVYTRSTTAKQVAKDMRSNRDEYSDYDVQYVYVCDENKVLVGVLRLRDLLLASPDAPVANLMARDPVSVRVDRTLHELYQLFQEYDYIGLPVVDHEGRLVGVLHRSAVEESMSEEATENFLKISGLQGNEELRSMPLLLRSRRRLSWLSINIVLNFIAASIIAMNQDTLEQVIALAVFLPIISDMSGCSGNQAVGVSIRELTLGLVKPREFGRVFIKEAGVGLVNGAVLGLLVAVAGTLWQGNAWFGLVVGSALMLNTLVAVLIGGLVPLTLKAIKLDPALASGPILTTVTDMCGFFLVLFFASQMIAYLV